MADNENFAQLMQQLQASSNAASLASMPEGASSAPTSSTGLLPNGKKTKGRVKIKMEYINNKLRRYTTFSKRKTGIMKKAYELSTLTGTQVMLLVASETGHVYTYATKKLQPMISSDAGKALIQTCLNAPGEGSDTAPNRTEFTFDSGNGSNMRKRKVIDPIPDPNSIQSFSPFLPTMAPLFSSFGEDDYNNDESGDDSDSEEAASEIKEEDQGSPSMVVIKKEEPDMDNGASAVLHQTIRDALKAAASTRQQQQKKAKTSHVTPTQSSHSSKSSFVAPFLLKGLTATSTNNGTVFNLPQGTVYTSTANEGGANANTIFNSAAKQGDDASVMTSLLSLPGFNLQQFMESAALSAASSE